MKRLKCAYRIVVEYWWCPFNCLALAEQIPVSSGRKSFQVWRLLLFDLPVPLCHLSPFQQLRNTAVSEPNIIKRSSLGLQKVKFPESVQQMLSTLLQISPRWSLKKQPDDGGCFWWTSEQNAGSCAACGPLGEDCHCSLGWIHHFCLTALRGCLSQLHLPLPPCLTLKWWKILSQCFGRQTNGASPPLL